MTRLRHLARLIRSKNAGPFHLTFDIMFDDADIYQRVCASGVLNADLFARLFHAPPTRVRIYHYNPGLAVKVTIPRPVASGDLGDPDCAGGQYYAPLVDLEIPD